MSPGASAGGAEAGTERGLPGVPPAVGAGAFATLGGGAGAAWNAKCVSSEVLSQGTWRPADSLRTAARTFLKVSSTGAPGLRICSSRWRV